MCQLLGMNTAEPTSFHFSFSGFAKRGGESDNHTDGWGLAFYDTQQQQQQQQQQHGAALRTVIDPTPAAQSPIAAVMGRDPITKTMNMMAHIRYATRGGVRKENVHPFTREMWGIQWCFAHNGDIPRFSQNHPSFNPHLITPSSSSSSPSDVVPSQQPHPLLFTPHGDTDSEHTFCAILNALHVTFSSLPSLPILYQTLQNLCNDIVHARNNHGDVTICNFLLSCGPTLLFAYSHPGRREGSNVWNGLYYTLRSYPFAEGEVRLVDRDDAMDFSKCNTERDRVAVIATKPLTINERWVEFGRGDLLLFDRGEVWVSGGDERSNEGVAAAPVGRDRPCHVLLEPALSKSIVMG